MQIRVGWRSLALFLLLQAGGVAVGASATPRVDAAYFSKVADCVEQAAAARSAGAAAAGARFVRTPYFEVFVFEAVSERLALAAKSGGKLPEADIMCADVAKVHAATRAEALRSVHAEASDKLAPLGTMAIESSSTFLRLAQNHIGVHWLGHSDLTGDALSKLAASIRISDDGALVVRRASQTPDQYLWDDSSYHAHTPDYASGDAQARQRAVAKGTEAFLTLVAARLAAFTSHAERGRTPEALFQLGVLSHMVQDLVYHRGMTMREHAGLSYLLHNNPDMPGTELARVRSNEAVQATVALVQRAVSGISQPARERLAGWSKPDAFSFPALAKTQFPAGEDIGIPSLAAYFLLAFTYGEAQRPLAELDQDDACSRPAGRACWNVVDVLGKALKP